MLRKTHMIELSHNEICQRLERVEQTLADHNLHDESFVVGIALQAFRGKGDDFTGDLCNDLKALAEQAHRRRDAEGVD